MGLVQCSMVPSLGPCSMHRGGLRLGLVQCAFVPALGHCTMLAWVGCLRLGLVQCFMAPSLGPCSMQDGASAWALCNAPLCLRFGLVQAVAKGQRQAKASRKANAVPGYSRANSKTCWHLPLLTAAELHASLLLGLLPSCGNPAILVCSLFPFIKAIAGLTVLEAAHLTAAADAFRPWVLGQSRLPCRLCFPW